MGRWHLVDEATAEKLRNKSKKTVELLKSTVVLGLSCGPLVACNPKGSMAMPIEPRNTTCTEENLTADRMALCCVHDPEFGVVNPANPIDGGPAATEDGGLAPTDGGAATEDHWVPWCDEDDERRQQARDVLDELTPQRCCPTEEQWQNLSSN